MGESAGASRSGWIIAAALGVAIGALVAVAWLVWLGHAAQLTPRESLERRIALGAAALPAPPGPSDASQTSGYRQYAANCVACHGEPGGSRAVWAIGLDPAASDLPGGASRRDARQIFWILCHGEPGTGMPAFRAHRTDQALWDLALFTRDLPSLGPAAYANLKSTWPPAPPPSGLAPDATCFEKK
jgi:mono/diheme cytochrome c family protein